MKRWFGPEGVFSKTFPAFEFRREQLELAEKVWDCLNSGDGKTFLAEAPTGIGKTLALLVPGALWALSSSKRILYLTSTITLQEHLLRQHLPQLKDILGSCLRFGVLKGRRHYACPLKVREWCEQGMPEGAEGEKSPSRGELSAWVRLTETGELAELGISPESAIAGKLSATKDGCRGASCPNRNECFLYRMYREAQNWDVVIANYHLFFSHAPSAFPVLYDALFCDEAHHVAEAARSAVTRRACREDWLRITELCTRHAVSSLAKEHPQKAEALKKAAQDCAEKVGSFFDAAAGSLEPGTLFERPEDLPLQAKDAIAAADDMIGKGMACLEQKNLFGESDTLHSAAGQWLDEASGLRDTLAWCSRVDMFPEWGYWWDGLCLVSVPADCSSFVPEWVGQDHVYPVIAVSATMALGGDMSYWESETGLAADEKVVLDSPFHLARQMEIWVVDIGLTVTDNDYDDRVARVVEKLCDMNDGRTLVLLSSHRLLKKVGTRLKLKEKPYKILVQGEAPPGVLAEAFRKDHSSVLVGSVSYREGVDVPGDGLTQVVIDRIPFQHPRDPLLRTRRALYGGRLFPEIVLPMAKMYLKQAAGRLIRTASDSGRVVILDNRVLTREDWDIPEDLPRVGFRRVKLSGLSVARR
ncbi:MAG: ATP-dependent DNA helicase [Thermovirgaceae bacterium]